MVELTKDDISRLRMVKRTVLDWETITSADLYNKLSEKYKNKGTLSVICYSLKKVFDIEGDKKKANFWGEKGAELAQEVNNIEMQGELVGDNEKKKWHSQKDIIEFIKRLQEKKNLSKTDYNRYILLCLCVYQPPLRKSFYLNLKFLFNPKKNNKKDNFLLLQKSPLKSYYIVNNDKVSRHAEFDKDENKFIELLNKDLINMLWKSYEGNKRDYVFTSSNEKPYSKVGFTKTLLEPINLNFHTLRSSYVSDYYVKNPYPQERMQVARMMRHSKSTGETNYLKRTGTQKQNNSDNEDI